MPRAPTTPKPPKSSAPDVPPDAHAAPIAEKLASQQKSISIAEFFEKNKQMLGFDSLQRCLLTTVKEAVDNALDACEEAGILPDLLIEIKASRPTRTTSPAQSTQPNQPAQPTANLIVTIEDNGPGIVREQIPRVFAKLLYGSRFHALKQSRGQQGIGISASVLYAQLSTGKPTEIISKIGSGEPAHYCKLMIDTSRNEPEILEEQNTDWDPPHGTRVELEIKASYVKGRRQSVLEYLRNTAIVNPHARITLVDPDGERTVFERATDILPEPPKEIKPHPAGIELGTLVKMLRHTDRKRLSAFLKDSFVRIGAVTSEEICSRAGLLPAADPGKLTHEEAERLQDALRSAKIAAPPTDCLSPISEDLIRKGVLKEYSIDFIATTKRTPAVFNGNPFLVEAAIAYGGDLPADGKADILRFANRVPLLYQQGACAVTHAIERINWKYYGLTQPGGFPSGPCAILVHVASTNVPFTSESKNAIADVPEILDEVENAVRNAASRLRKYLGKQESLSKRKEKENLIKKVLPRLATKVSEILGMGVPNIDPVVARIMGNLLVNRSVRRNESENVFNIEIRIENHTGAAHSMKVHDLIPFEIVGAEPEPRMAPVGDKFDYLWEVSLRSGEGVYLRYAVESDDEGLTLPALLVEGVSAELVTGARVLGGAD
ncbi:MAG: DNA topoisomerase VI subunit B [Methanosarcinales archaeon]|nr:DNA topoisomerase VI subunit B [Methanosarcinales archaeon]